VYRNTNDIKSCSISAFLILLEQRYERGRMEMNRHRPGNEAGFLELFDAIRIEHELS
jgi:hypothetical protein